MSAVAAVLWRSQSRILRVLRSVVVVAAVTVAAWLAVHQVADVAAGAAARRCHGQVTVQSRDGIPVGVLCQPAPQRPARGTVRAGMA